MKKVFFLVLVWFVSCSHQQYQIKYVDTAFDTSNISKIAIFDFDNKTDIDLMGSYAAERLEYYVEKESKFIAIDRKKVHQAVEAFHLKDNAWVINSAKVKEIGKSLAVDALIVGTIAGIDDSHAQVHYTKEFDTSFYIIIEIRDVKNGRILYTNNCHGGDDDMTIHYANPQFFEKRIARKLINECIQKLSSEFLPKKVKVPAEE